MYLLMKKISEKKLLSVYTTVIYMSVFMMYHSLDDQASAKIYFLLTENSHFTDYKAKVAYLKPQISSRLFEPTEPLKSSRRTL